jgi:Ankyrin repeats (3 copies)
VNLGQRRKQGEEPAEQPFRIDLDYYEGRACGIATANGISLADARRALAQRHGASSWTELTRRVRALASGEEPPTPFMLAYRAVEDGDLERLRPLLDEHPELVRQRGTNGNDLFGMAGDLDVTRLLLERGAGGPDHGQGVTALHLAAQSGRVEAVETLLELGADPTIRDALHDGTPAGWARHGCHPGLAERLG